MKNEIQYFMGKVIFLPIFINDFAKITKPIHNLLKRDHVFKWDDSAQRYFISIKEAISPTLALEKPNFIKEFSIYTNAI